MKTHVALTINALDLTDKDAAAVKLAFDYADALDAHRGPEGDPKLRAWAVRWIAPQLLDVLESLGATPRARKVKAGKPGDAKPNRLHALRETWQAEA